MSEVAADEATTESVMSAAVVANLCEAAVMVAASKGMDVTTAREVRVRFEDTGDVTLTILSDDGGTLATPVTADELQGASDLDEDTEP